MKSQALLTLALTLAPQHGGVMYHFPQWSPDGRWILVSSTLDGDSELYLISPDGQPMKKLTDNSASDDLGRWIDHGKRILFTSDRNGKPGTFVMNADGSDPRAIEERAEEASVSANERFELREDQGRIVVVDRKTGARRTVTTGTWAEQPSFSPDGSLLVYEQRSTTDPHRVEQSNVVVASADGSGARIVSPGTDPSWSPDGRLLLFKVWDQTDSRLFVTVAHPDGTGIRRLGEGVHPQWSPDGRLIVFMREGTGGTHVWIMKADGMEQRCLTCGR